MPTSITKHIPNLITCLNLFSGCIACVMAFEGKYTLALGFIILGAIFDFFDGFFARLLQAYSPIGKELDSLADDISFGLAPAIIVFTFLREPDLSYPIFLLDIKTRLPYLAFLIAVFSALRLAKFNVDTRQTDSFIGLPTPANALFWSSFIAGSKELLLTYTNVIYILVLVFIFSGLLVMEIPMFSLKFKSFTWKENKIRYLFLLVCIPLIFLFKLSGVAAVILWYIILSLLTQRKRNLA
ncbi:MAG: CDP-diacylglycerol--serine O-phosphatidyltransferase [Bacteroidales bacterium]|nr:CDP-diacylglycerol--serine O-phosphatidyltransferase [Bacteroidales bacterium]